MLTEEQIAKLDKLSQELLGAFRQVLPDTTYREELAENLELTIPAKNSEVGGISAVSDGEEITVYIGEYFHCHFSPYLQDTYPSDEANQEVAQQAVEYIADILDDKIVLRLNIENGAFRMSQTYYRDMEEAPPGPEDREYVWSGRL
jgi:hypothetical protein